MKFSSEFRSGSGSFDGATLKIGNMEFPVADILSVAVSDNEFYLSMADESAGVRPIIIEFYGTDVVELEYAINAARSSHLASEERNRSN